MPRCPKCKVVISEEDAVIYGMCDRCEEENRLDKGSECSDEYIESLSDFDDYDEE